MIGRLNRKRFSLKYPDGTIARFGSHNCHNDDGRNLAIRDGNVYLESDMHSQEHPAIMPVLLPPETQAANGYYDYEWDRWVPVKEFVFQEI